MFKPTVGPIIGHTTTNHARIFLRGELQNDALVFAGIRYRRTGEKHWSKGVFAKLTLLRDMSDVIALNDLATDTDYEYQAGWFSPMSPVHTWRRLRSCRCNGREKPTAFARSPAKPPNHGPMWSAHAVTCA